MVDSLADTIDLMKSSDYKDRFKAEYYQLEYRLVRLKDMIRRWDENGLSFTPTVNREVYTRQIAAMDSYLKVLKERASYENINLW
jgi:hypothetical protein